MAEVDTTMSDRVRGMLSTEAFGFDEPDYRGDLKQILGWMKDVEENEARQRYFREKLEVKLTEALAEVERLRRDCDELIVELAETRSEEGSQ